MGAKCCKFACCFSKKSPVIASKETEGERKPNTITEKPSEEVGLNQKVSQASSKSYKSAAITDKKKAVRRASVVPPLDLSDIRSSDENPLEDSHFPLNASDRGIVEIDSRLEVEASFSSEHSLLFYDKNSQIEDSVDIHTARENLAQAHSMMRSKDLSKVFIRIIDESSDSESMPSPKDLSRVQRIDFKSLFS